MAEGGDHSNSARGSDAYFEHTCTPCADEGDSQEALKYCPECKEYLCATCVKHHKKVSATKKHRLHDKDFKEIEEDSVNTKTDDKMFKCINHPNRDIEMYCGAHEMIYCSLCIAIDHRQCNGIQAIDEAAEKVSINNEDVTLDMIDSFLTDIQATRKKKQNNMYSLKREKSDILKTIEDTEQLIIENVKKLASDAKSKTSVRYDELKNELQAEEYLLLQTVADTTELRYKVETQEELDTTRQFVRQILQKHNFTATKIMHDGVEKHDRKMKCFKNDELIQQVSSAGCLVQIVGSKSRFNTKHITISKRSQKKVNIKGKTDKEECSSNWNLSSS